MAIEVNVPIEIDDYKEKILFGLTVRKLLCLTAAIICGIVCGVVCVSSGMDISTAGYVIMLCAGIPLAFGFVTIKGMSFERYLQLRLRCMFRARQKYISDEEMEGGNQNAGIYKKSTFSGRSTGSECTISIPRDAARRNRRAAKRCIRAAQKEYLAAAREKEHLLRTDVR